MRHLVTGPRRSGRTYRFIQELPEGDTPIFIMASTFGMAQIIKTEIARLRGVQFASRVRPMGVDSLPRLRGVDPYNIFFEHTAYEYASSSQLREIYLIEDMANPWNGDT